MKIHETDEEGNWSRAQCKGWPWSEMTAVAVCIVGRQTVVYVSG